MLNWAIIGSGDVVERLVQDSLNVKLIKNDLSDPKKNDQYN